MRRIRDTEGRWFVAQEERVFGWQATVCYFGAFRDLGYCPTPPEDHRHREEEIGDFPF
jgi:hypothetical protein